MKSTRDEGKAKRAWELLPDVLTQLGYKDLRSSQKPCIDSLFGGEDTICILPTSGGKTALAQIPTLVFGYKTVVFSPLVALMADQVKSCNMKNIRADAINSAQSTAENTMALQNWINGNTDILFVAPERITNQQFRAAMNIVSPTFVVVDEMHCLFAWSSSFRPEYRNVGDFVQEYQPQQVLAMTATATKEIVDCVKEVLGLPDMRIENHYEERLNLKLSSSWCGSEEEANMKVLQMIRKIEGSIIVYCASIRHVVELTQFLQAAGESVTCYHGQMTAASVKEINQNDFMEGRARVMVATNAFGMGIDKSDIRAVIHADPPGSLEAVAQETGRAARDGQDAICHMFFHPTGESVQQRFWFMSNPDGDMLSECYSLLLQFKERNKDVVMKTLQELQDASGKTDDVFPVQAAIGMLASIGCVERTKPAEKIAKCVLVDAEWMAHCRPAQARVLDAVLQVGVEDTTVKTNSPVYMFDIDSVVEKLKTASTTVMAHLRQLNKEGVIVYKPPFKGKITILKRPPTDQEKLNATIRRALEYKKLENVLVDYKNCPDSEKQQLLTDYFGRQVSI